MKLVRIASIVFALFAVTLAGCQTDGTASASGSSYRSSGGGGY